jgi:hypothetical protein
MNKRIKELAVEAGVVYYTRLGRETNLVELQKFADLIVRECARVASDYDGAHYVGTAIEEHFGVEE